MFALHWAPHDCWFPAYLISKLGLTADAAIALIRQCRPCISINPGFVWQLQRFAAITHQRRSPSSTTTLASLKGEVSRGTPLFRRQNARTDTVMQYCLFEAASLRKQRGLPCSGFDEHDASSRAFLDIRSLDTIAKHADWAATAIALGLTKDSGSPVAGSSHATGGAGAGGGAGASAGSVVPAVSASLPAPTVMGCSKCKAALYTQRNVAANHTPSPLCDYAFVDPLPWMGSAVELQVLTLCINRLPTPLPNATRARACRRNGASSRATAVAPSWGAGSGPYPWSVHVELL